MRDTAYMTALFKKMGVCVYASGSGSTYTTVGDNLISVYSYGGGSVTLTNKAGKTRQISMTAATTSFFNAETLDLIF